MVFVGAQFCSHCGAKIERVVEEGAKAKACPRCQIPLEAVVIGTANLQECKKCEGLWADKEVFLQICADREKQASVLNLGVPATADGVKRMEEKIFYLPCPVCQQLMNRVNFAQCSRVIVDVCRDHGTWFDKDELREIVEFIRSGGMEKARLREIDELQRSREQLRSSQIDSGPVMEPVNSLGMSSNSDWGDVAIDVLGAVLKNLFR
jgi:Zn-finger nucleic acid-binding protein